MASPTPLSRPPISEALVDFRASVAPPKEAFHALAKELESRFPRVREMQQVKAVLQVKDGRLEPSDTEALGYHGVRLETEDGSLVVQFRPDGFTLNNLKTYLGGDLLIEEAVKWWSLFASRMKPDKVSRVALRYINKLELPLRDGDSFDRFLTSAPDMPAGAPQAISDFLCRVVGFDEVEQVRAIVTQRFGGRRGGGNPSLLIDLDVFKQDEFAPTAELLRPVLQSLRIHKNRIFFALLTDAAVELYR